MKNTWVRMTGMLAPALLATTKAVRAQEPLDVDIPFAFTAGSKALAAGEYRMQKVRVIRSPDRQLEISLSQR